MIALAALSARVLAEAAAREGIDAVALDLFGDRDTCRAVADWRPIGIPEALQIDAAALLDALASLARRGDVRGWVAGAGFEGRPDLLAAGAERLPLLGTAGDDVRRVRDPATFFGFLTSRGFRFPPLRPLRAGAARGWLTKDAGGCGGWHITRATPGGDSATAGEPHQPGQRYQQREARGVPMSATFIANGRDAVLLGFNEQIVASLGARPYVYRGVLGPVPLFRRAAAEVTAVVRACAERFALRGLGSLDFLLDAAQRVLVLEVNPRPPASLALYPRAGTSGTLQAHLDACIDGRLPAAAVDAMVRATTAHDADRADGATVRGNEIIYAPRALQCSAAAVDRLACWPGTHDLPRTAMRFDAGAPICSVSASGASVAAVKAGLTRRRKMLLRFLDPPLPRRAIASTPPLLELAP